jgi:hypothetical protein
MFAILVQGKPLVDFLFAAFEAVMEASDLRDSVNELVATEDEEEPSAGVAALRRSMTKSTVITALRSPKSNAVQPESYIVGDE